MLYLREPVESSPFFLDHELVSGLLLDAVCPPSGFFVDVVFLIVPADTVHQPFRPTIRPINQGKLHTLRDSLSKKELSHMP